VSSGSMGAFQAQNKLQICQTKPVAASRAGVVMMGVDPNWKTELTGGFPGGEAFYKKWIEEGTTGEVPALEKEKQPTSPNKKKVIFEFDMISKRGQQKGVDPSWKNLFAGGFPGGEFFYKKWIGEGAKDTVPNLDDELQPSATPVPKKGAAAAAPAAAKPAAAAAAPFQAAAPAPVEKKNEGVVTMQMVNGKITYFVDGKPL